MQHDEQQIRRVIATWFAATRAGDTDAVLELMADDVVFLLAGHEPMLGKAAFAASMRRQAGPAAPQFDARSEVQEVRVLGDWAWVRTQLTVVVTPRDGGTANTRAGHTLSIFRKEHGRWLLARDANLLVPVDAPAGRPA